MRSSYGSRTWPIRASPKPPGNAGGFYAPSSFGIRPLVLGGDALGDRFDVVVHMHGLAGFAQEWANTREVVVEGVPLRVLNLSRIIESKKATGRTKDLAQVPALEEALAAIGSEGSSAKE